MGKKKRFVSKKILILVLIFLVIIFTTEVFFLSQGVSSFSKDTSLSAPEDTTSEAKTATGAVTLTIVAPPNEKD